MLSNDTTGTRSSDEAVGEPSFIGNA